MQTELNRNDLSYDDMINMLKYRLKAKSEPIPTETEPKKKLKILEIKSIIKELNLKENTDVYRVYEFIKFTYPFMVCRQHRKKYFTLTEQDLELLNSHPYICKKKNQLTNQ